MIEITVTILLAMMVLQQSRASSDPRGQKDCPRFMLILYNVLYVYVWLVVSLSLWHRWAETSDSSCSHQVDATILSNKPSKYFGDCDLTIQWDVPIGTGGCSNEPCTFTEQFTMSDSSWCSPSSKDQQGPGVGQLIRGCVAETLPDHFVRDTEAHSQDLDKSFLFTMAASVTAIGALLLVPLIIVAKRSLGRYDAAKAQQLCPGSDHVCAVCGVYAHKDEQVLSKSGADNGRLASLL